MTRCFVYKDTQHLQIQFIFLLTVSRSWMYFVYGVITIHLAINNIHCLKYQTADFFNNQNNTHTHMCAGIEICDRL